MLQRARALAPAAGLALLSFWAGTFHGAAGGREMATVHLVLLAAVAFAPWLLDPLRLGNGGAVLTAALLVAAAAGVAASPVPRAGWTAVVLLPAWLLVPGAVARAWRSPEARALGLRGVSLVVLAVAAAALADHLLAGSPRAAMPLGHHNLLAVWLLATLPLATVPLIRTPWPQDGVGRLLAALAGGTGLAALLATRSLAGTAGLAVLAVGAALAAAPRHRRWVLVAAALLALVLAALFLPRLAAVATGDDPSTAARRTYWLAGLRGGAERPLLGWGAGSVPWTLPALVEPRPGVNPPGEVVGDVHSTPVQLFYETGATGLALVLALAILFAWRRWRDLGARDVAAETSRGGGSTVGPANEAAWAGLWGLAAAGVALLASSPLSVPAVAAALALAAGAALPPPAPPLEPAGSPAFGLGRASGRHAGKARAALVALLALLLVPVDAAHLAFDRARTAASADEAARWLRTAVRLDPAFPLYRARLAALEGSAALARDAAEGAPGVAALWLLAGRLGAERGSPRAEEALVRSCRLDPLGPAAPFLLAAGDPASSLAAERTARALLAEPRLGAATFWDGRPALRAAAVDEVWAWPGLSAGWRDALARTVAALPPGPPAEPGAEPAELRLGMDRVPAEAASLHAFRRRPWPLDLAAFAVWPRRAAAIELPPAAVLRETSAEAFGARGCRPEGP